MKEKLPLILAVIFFGIVISNTIGQLNKRIKTYETETKTQTERIEELKTENQNLKNDIEAEKKRADARVEQRLANEKQIAYKPPVKATGGCEQYRDMVSQYDWDINTALFVMSKESGCNPNAISRTNDHGLLNK